MDDDDLAASRESSRKRAAEGERKSRSNSLSEQIDRNLRARFSDENSSRLAATSGVYSSGLLSREQHLLELSQLQRLRDLQLLASERVSQQSFEQPGLVYQYGGRNPRMPNMDELSAATSPNFGLPLDRQLNMYQSAGRESPATRDIGRILRDEAQSASYPLFREADQLSRFAPSARVAESPAVNSYMDLLEQLRHQELLNERLRQEAHRRERQQHQLHPRQERENPSTSVPQVSSAMTNVPYSRVHRTKKKLPSQQRLPMETAPTYKPGIPLELPSDKEKLTTYQALIRASLEYFKATQDDINTTVQGRRQKLQCGQIGIRCKFCAHLPLGHLLRGKGSSSYPKTKISVYQAAQNIASAHLSKPCSFMPETMQEQIETERLKKGASKAGQNYWVKACDELGFIERDGGLWHDEEEEEHIALEKGNDSKNSSDQTKESPSPGKERK